MIPSRFLAARSIAGPAGMALLYFATAATTVHISRFSGGVDDLGVKRAARGICSRRGAASGR
jgi:hypothetical protein